MIIHQYLSSYKMLIIRDHNVLATHAAMRAHSHQSEYKMISIFEYHMNQNVSNLFNVKHETWDIFQYFYLPGNCRPPYPLNWKLGQFHHQPLGVWRSRWRKIWICPRLVHPGNHKLDGDWDLECKFKLVSPENARIKIIYTRVDFKTFDIWSTILQKFKI